MLKALGTFLVCLFAHFLFIYLHPLEYGYMKLGTLLVLKLHWS